MSAGRGFMGFLGGILEQSPYTRAFMNAGRQGLLAARSGRQIDDEAQNLDLGEAFLGVGPKFGYKGQAGMQQTPGAAGVSPGQAGGGSGASRLMMPQQLQAPSGSTTSRGLTDEDLEAMLSELYDPFGRIA